MEKEDEEYTVVKLDLCELTGALREISTSLHTLCVMQEGLTSQISKEMSSIGVLIEKHEKSILTLGVDISNAIEELGAHVSNAFDELAADRAARSIESNLSALGGKSYDTALALLLQSLEFIGKGEAGKNTSSRRSSPPLLLPAGNSGNDSDISGILGGMTNYDFDIIIEGLSKITAALDLEAIAKAASAVATAAWSAICSAATAVTGAFGYDKPSGGDKA